MPYVAVTVIAHPQCVCREGHEVRRCPATLLKQFIKDGVVKLVGDDGPAEALILDQDMLTPLNQKQLLKVITLNGLKAIRPMNNWTDEQIRQAIRDFCEDINTLKLPPDASAPLITDELS